MALLLHRNPPPITLLYYFSSCSTSVVQGIISDNSDSPCVKLVGAAGGAAHDWHGDGRQSSKPAVLITRPSAAPSLTRRWDFDCSMSWCSTFTSVDFLALCSSFCNNISIWSRQKVSVADSRYDLLTCLWGKIPPGPQNHIKTWLVGSQLRPIDILFTQAWANISKHRDTSWRSRVSQDEEFTYNNGGERVLHPTATSRNITPLDTCDQYQQRFMFPVAEVIFHRGKLLFFIVR